MLQRFGEFSLSAVQRLHIRSALNPMLWLCGISTPLCFFFAFVFRLNPDLQFWLVIAGLVPIGVACLGFVGFAIFRPEKLQSEDLWVPKINVV